MTKDWKKEFEDKFIGYLEKDGNVIRSDTDLVKMIEIESFIDSLLTDMAKEMKNKDYINGYIDGIKLVLHNLKNVSGGAGRVVSVQMTQVEDLLEQLESGEINHYYDGVFPTIKNKE